MTFLSTRELYALFLDSDFWINLSRTKRRSVGRCENCGTRNKLESHHVFYRDSWFDTQLSDLKVLCRSCHEAQHGIKETVEKHSLRRRKRRARLRNKSQRNQKLKCRVFPEKYADFGEVLFARGQGLLSRQQFLKLKALFAGQQKRTSAHWFTEGTYEVIEHRYGHYRKPYRSKWISRG